MRNYNLSHHNPRPGLFDIRDVAAALFPKGVHLSAESTQSYPNALDPNVARNL